MPHTDPVQGDGKKTLVQLEYGHGFERYGSYECDGSGWDVKLDGEVVSNGGRTPDLPKAVMLAERSQQLRRKGDPDVCYNLHLDATAIIHFQNP